MNGLFSSTPPRWRRLLWFAAWGVFIVWISVNLPCLFNLMSRGIDSITALFPRPNESWKECPRCF